MPHSSKCIHSSKCPSLRNTKHTFLEDNGGWMPLKLTLGHQNFVYLSKICLTHIFFRTCKRACFGMYIEVEKGSLELVNCKVSRAFLGIYTEVGKGTLSLCWLTDRWCQSLAYSLGILLTNRQTMSKSCLALWVFCWLTDRWCQSLAYSLGILLTNRQMMSKSCLTLWVFCWLTDRWCQSLAYSQGILLTNRQMMSKSCLTLLVFCWLTDRWCQSLA